MAKATGARDGMSLSMAEPPCVFLDRDGVINRKRPEGDYVKAWGEFELLPGVPEALRLLAQAGCRVVIVTNQRGVALGRMTVQGVEEIHRRMREALAQAGARVDGVYYCPHDNGSCDCRKPGTGLFRRAQRDLGYVDFSHAVVIGDSEKDMEAGSRLGCRTVLLVEPGAAAEKLAELRARGIPITGHAASLLEAVVEHVITHAHPIL